MELRPFMIVARNKDTGEYMEFTDVDAMAERLSPSSPAWEEERTDNATTDARTPAGPSSPQ